MDKDTNSFTSKKTPPIKVELDEFQINEDTFKPMTKGLGFHQDTKRPSFKPAPKEVKAFGSTKTPVNPSLNSIPTSMTQVKSTAQANHLPTGLEAFYGAKPVTPEAPNNLFERSIKEETKKEKVVVSSTMETAPQTAQFLAWVIDVLVIASFVVLTGALLIFASGIEFNMYSRLISNKDLMIFTAAIFSIYYVLYFTILDLSSSPGKTIFGLRLVKVDGNEVTVKHTFGRAIISLVSGVALFLPMLLDFQGRLSDTKVVK
jgi:uncharacterized RDD family membrane protein YckC